MDYDNFAPFANKVLQPDGSITDLSGNPLYPPDPELAEQWEKSAPLANKMLNSDGSITGLPDGGGGGGATSYSALTGKPQLNGVTLQSGNNTLESLKLSYTYTQNTAATVWTVPHNLNDANVLIQVIDNATGMDIISLYLPLTTWADLVNGGDSVSITPLYQNLTNLSLGSIGVQPYYKSKIMNITVVSSAGIALKWYSYVDIGVYAT
jgi:hypothetical protein